MSARITIAFTRYAEPNWLVRETLASLSDQREVEADVLVLDQHEDAEIRACVEQLRPGQLRFHYIVIDAIGSSYARNKAIEMSENDIILFMDCDALADPLWAHHMQGTLERESVGVAGSRIIPKWHGKPLFIARSPMVRRIYSLLELGEGEVPTTDLWGVGFGIHRGRLGDNAYWDERIGRSYGNLLSGEDTDLCARANQMGLESIYNGAAVMTHQILPERISYRWIMRRVYYAGVERMLTEESPRPSTKNRVFMDYVAYILTLPALLLGFWHGRRMRTAGN